MEFTPPNGPAHVTELDGRDGERTGYPALVGQDGEILAFVALGDVEGALYAYSPFGGWRCINAESLERGANPEKSWIQSKSDGITDPVPAGMRGIEDFEGSRRVKAELSEASDVDD